MPGTKKQYHCFNFFKHRLLDCLSDGKPRTSKEIAEKLGVSSNDVAAFMSRNMRMRKRMVKRLKLKDKTERKWQYRYSISKHGFVLLRKYLNRFQNQQTLNLKKNLKAVPTYINITKSARADGITLRTACEKFHIQYHPIFIPSLAKNQDQASNQKKQE